MTFFPEAFTRPGVASGAAADAWIDFSIVSALSHQLVRAACTIRAAQWRYLSGERVDFALVAKPACNRKELLSPARKPSAWGSPVAGEDFAWRRGLTGRFSFRDRLSAYCFVCS